VATSRPGTARLWTITVLVVVLLAAAAAVVWFVAVRSSEAGAECVVPGDPARAAELPEVQLTAAQLQHASTINAVGMARGLPERARVIALATAWQESTLRNLPDGDRDSVGLFQQRPSQGWGDAAEIRDPVYAAGRFYDALLDVPQWDALPLTEAAQSVQYSGFPDAYAKWEPEAATLARQLGGTVPLSLTCRADALASTAPEPTRPPVPGAETAAAPLAGLLAAAAAEFGAVTVRAVGDDGRSAEVSADLATTGESDAARALAAWSLARTARFGVTEVAAAGQRCTADGWADDGTAPAAGTSVVVS
jgi:hypothetical protein